MKISELKNKTVIVTGGSRGIGRAVALKFGELGCNVIINYLNSEDEALDVRDSIENIGGKAYIVRADVTDYNQAKKLVDFVIREFDTVHILVNNVGYYEKKEFLDLEYEDWEQIFKANFYSAVNMTKLVLPLMISQNWGRIINISSISGIRGSPKAPHYASAKAALIALTKSLAKHYGKYNILINSIAPGPTETDTLRKWFTDKEINDVISKTPLKRIGKPEDIADAVVYLTVNDYISGETIVVSGGYL